MDVTYIRDADSGTTLRRALDHEDRFALDCEAAGFHRYSDRLSLIQVSADGGTFIVDPLAFDPTELLADAIGDPATRVIMHGADFDVRLLDRDLGIRIRGLFDTQVAAALLGENALGLSSLLEKHLGVRLSKKHQRADWAQRPLPDELVTYAAADTRHLLELADLLEERLREKGRLEWALEESGRLEEVAWDEEDEDADPVEGVKAARDLPPREVAGLREALEWRDEIAREQDRAPFRVAGDRALLRIVAERPSSPEAMADVKGVSSALAREAGADLIRRLERVRSLPDDEIEGYPRRQRTGPGRPPPEVEERADRLRRVRNRRADELGVDRGTLMPNATLLEVARAEPSSPEALERVEGVRKWQIEALGDELLSALEEGARRS